MSKTLVVWSGGFDSTALLLYLIDQKLEFETLYIDLDNNHEKNLLEKNARMKIQTALKEEYDITFVDHIVNFPSVCTESHSGNNKGATLTQPYIWLNGTMIFLMDVPQFDYVTFGYIVTDCFWHIKHPFKEAYQSLYKLLAIESEAPTLWFPFEWFNKKRIFTDYYDKDSFRLNLINMTWTCEDPAKNLPCNKCRACRRFNIEIRPFIKRRIKSGKIA